MRKSLWIILAVLGAAIVAPAAQADSVTYTFTINAYDPGAVLTLVSSSGFITCCGIYSLTESSDPSLTEILISSSGADTIIFGNSSAYSFGDFFPDADLGSYGSYESTDGAAIGGVFALTVSPTATPEPGSSALTLSGVCLLGLMLVVRKRLEFPKTA